MKKINVKEEKILSSNNKLTDITIDGVSIKSFNPNINRYEGIIIHKPVIFVDIKGNDPNATVTGVGSSFTYFVIKKTLNNGQTKTKIISNKGINETIIDSGIPCIPLEYNEIIRSLFNKVVFNDNPKYKVQTSSNLHRTTKKEFLSDKQDAQHPYRIIHTPNQTVWATRPHIYQDGWKVFLPTTTYYHPYIDNDCGMTQSIAFILCDSQEEAEKICNEISLPVYKTIVDLTRYGNFNNQRILQHLSLLSTFELTPEEEKFVNTYPYK